MCTDSPWMLVPFDASMLQQQQKQKLLFCHNVRNFFFQNYKKRTEIAKKEYLKQLAAYRASLVSQVRIQANSVIILLADNNLFSEQLQSEMNTFFANKSTFERMDWGISTNGLQLCKSVTLHVNAVASLH